MAIPRPKPAYFLAISVVFAVTSVFALRANNQHMIELRNIVYAADKDNKDVVTPLRNLQAYVTSHMNTNLNAGPTPVYPPIQLKYSYERLVRAQGDAVAAANAKLYTAAQAFCEQQNSTDVSGRNRIPCIEQYVQQHNPQKLTQIPDALYKFAFVSPKWSPDLAGWSIVISILSGLAFIITLIRNRLFHKD
ncbi:MAG: hypothetical protein JWO35_201 [Candidatus Saccharibacteria bacterium]|nr:hypothetical protein [Candidatus Saccharibacteria bacterium]